MAPKFNSRTLAIGGVIYVATSSATYLYLKKGKPSPCPCPCPSHSTFSTSTNDTFDRIARDYDDNINLDELLMGVKLLRRSLVHQATGDVLEVSAGTGRNLNYYYKSPKQIKSLTLTDASREMLLRAHEKYSAAMAEAKKIKKKDVVVPRTSFLLADVENLCIKTKDFGSSAETRRIPREIEATVAAAETSPAKNNHPPQEEEKEEPLTRYGPALKTMHQVTPNSYDTVIDTFGLCSCENPVKALQEMAKALRPNGQLLLLEHGKGTWNFINEILDSSAEEHRKKWGCLWNRDIEALVKEAGLVVDEIERWHFGTTYVIRCKKKEKSSY